MISQKTDFDLRNFNTFRLPMTVSRFVEYDSADDLAALFADGTFDGRWVHIGGGSNLLLAADRYDGAVLHSALRTVEQSEVTPDGYLLVRLGAGLVLDDVAAETTSRGLYGLENLSGIPGEVGAGAVQNVGAYGVEFGQLVVQVEAFDTVTGKMRSFAREECGYGYRESRFKTGPEAGRYVVTHVIVRLNTRPSAVLTYGPLTSLPADTPPEEIRRRVLEIRRSKLPDVAEYGSAGSYFKNPVIDPQQLGEAEKKSGMEIPSHATDDGKRKLSAAWLIDHSGLKGSRAGGAALWPTQPLVIYNTGNATAADVIELEHKVAGGVKEKFGIDLVPEVQRIY